MVPTAAVVFRMDWPENNNSQFDCWVHGHRQNGDEVAHERLAGFETDGLTDLLFDWIDRCADDEQPFLAALSVQPPHDPMQAPQRRLNASEGSCAPTCAGAHAESPAERAGYYGMIENLDDNVGRTGKTAPASFIAHSTLSFSPTTANTRVRMVASRNDAVRGKYSVPMIFSGGDPLYHNYRMGMSDAQINHDLPTSLGFVAFRCQIDGWDRLQYLRNPKRRTGCRGRCICKGQFCATVLLTPMVMRGLVTRDGWKIAFIRGTGCCLI